MMSRGGTSLAGSSLAALNQRYFSTAARTVSQQTASGMILNGSAGAPVRSVSWMRAPVLGLRNGSSVALQGEKIDQVEKEPAGGKDEKQISYWGIPHEKVLKEDGTEWKWNCFKPWETYKADLSIDLKKHHVPTTFLDKMAYWTVKSLRWPTDLFFQVFFSLSKILI
ncbi:Alternative oxidase 1B [Tripterygium wilfordii]|uniref:Alternative oxidase 1B n=1 Tax=Tripterygium wilfordii TaxID=458696 RepID=A0A7J7CTL2_TRIWF|nr:Alternative oxidase 1B [Tripterygium wilfordii]